MREMENIFFSGTFGGEALSLAAAIATIDKMRSEPVIERLWETGAALAAGTRKRIDEYGLGKVIRLDGLAPWTLLAFGEAPGASSNGIKTIFVREMLRNGVLVNSSHNVTYAFGPSEMSVVLEAYDRTLAVVAEALAEGGIDARLGDDIIQPIFTVRQPA
jgi:glutamate-1-semialdehyde 2,1-aminomutase/spore coat polysaccharide biosynthesis protein SpsF